MKTIIGKILELLLGNNQKEREGIIFYFKSLIFLVLIVCFFSNRMWDMNKNIKDMLNVNKITDFIKGCQIGIYFFTSLAIIAFILIIVSSIVCFIGEEVFKKYFSYINRIKIGAENRLIYSLEDVLLLLMITYIFDENVLQNYIATYPDAVLVILLILFIWVFFTSIIKGIVDRFFFLKPYYEKEI